MPIELTGTFVTATLATLTLLVTCIVAFNRHYREMKAENNGTPMQKNQRIVLIIPSVFFVVILVTYILVFL